jgi:hypothetical protein
MKENFKKAAHFSGFLRLFLFESVVLGDGTILMVRCVEMKQ